MKINKGLNGKIFFLIVGAFISGAFIAEIINSIQNLSFGFRIYIKLIIFLLFIIDVVIYVKTGEEIVDYLLEQLR